MCFKKCNHSNRLTLGCSFISPESPYALGGSALEGGGPGRPGPAPDHAHSLRPRLSSQQPEGRVTTPGPGSAPWAPRPRSLRAALRAQARVQLGSGEGRPRASCRAGRPFPSCPGYSSSLFGFQPRFLREAFPGAPACVSAFPRRALRLSFPARCLLRN